MRHTIGVKNILQISMVIRCGFYVISRGLAGLLNVMSMEPHYGLDVRTSNVSRVELMRCGCYSEHMVTPCNVALTMTCLL